MRIVVQQPQFLPWVGLWAKLYASQLYVMYAGVEFSDSDHQHRVTVGPNSWLTLPVRSGSSAKLIKDVQLAEGHKLSKKIVPTLKQRYANKNCRYRDRLIPLFEAMDRLDDSQWLLDVVAGTFSAMAIGLMLTQEIVIDTTEREGDACTKLDACLRQYCPAGDCTYLSGGGAMDYMGYDSVPYAQQVYFQVMTKGVSPHTFLQEMVTAEDPIAVIRQSAVWRDKQGEERLWQTTYS